MGVEMFVKKMMAVAGAAAGFSLFAVGANAAPNPNFHIYIAYGQSNMAGNGDIVPSEDQANPPKNFIMLASHNANASQRSGKTNQSIKTGEWYPAIPPMFHPFENLSPADYFGRAMVDSLPGVTVGIIPVAIGAVSIRAFDKDQYEAYFRGDGKDIMSWGWPKDYDNNPPGRILELAKKAKEVGVIKGFIFHQGESDGTDANWRKTVYKTYKDIIDALDLDENEVPFVAGELLQEGNNCCGSKNGGIRELKNNFKKFGLASSKGLQGNGKDPYHFGRAGVIELGKRYCSEMLKLIDKTIDPNAPAVDLVDPSKSVVPDEPPEEYGPYTETIAIPGKVQAENYNKGGAEVAYHDESKGNEGGKLRKNDVDIYQPNMGIVVGHCQKGEWLKYTVNVEADGEYEISALVAGDNGSGSFVLYMDDKQIGTEMVNEGKGFDTFTEVSGGKATLTKGEHELKLEITKDWIDVDYIEFKAVVPSGFAKVRFDMTEAESSFSLFDMQGVKLGSFTARGMTDAMNIVRENAKLRKQSKGVFFVRQNGSKSLTKKVVIHE
ncbi:MAG: carbohydrate-binding protein [Fibrobacter sp.]|uniref:sialate O-acetylesterase n=1 Tax=Fibrobacter sp. TaxID=35828 RepID=UPI0025B8918A|nr:sialate O-acetylesterase [Fibrobacter sp.]MBQ7079606.1 carbohydrate-binding protein [Fibrobacter sp.]